MGPASDWLTDTVPVPDADNPEDWPAPEEERGSVTFTHSTKYGADASIHITPTITYPSYHTNYNLPTLPYQL